MYLAQKKVLIVSNRVDNTNNFELTHPLNPGAVFSFADSLDRARELLKTEKQHLIFCDLILSDGDATDLLSEMTRPGIIPSFLFCVTASQEQSYAENSVLKEGADDFIQTPCSPKVLSKRMAALSRRLKKIKTEQNINITDQISLSVDGHTLSINDNTLTLPRREFAILRLFAENPGRLFTREEIRRQIWNEDHGLNPRTVDVHIYNLRNKTIPGLIQTVQGKGYIFNKQHKKVK